MSRGERSIGEEITERKVQGAVGNREMGVRVLGKMNNREYRGHGQR